MKNIRIGVGAPTYNSVQRLERLLSSLEFCKDQNFDYRIVVLDDGTPDMQKRNSVCDLAARFKIDLIQHDRNEGIPKSWNDLTRHFDDIDYMILFNDDITVSHNWIKNFVYFMDNNPQVGSIGFPIMHIDPDSGLKNEQLPSPNEDSIPGKVGSPNGCSFGFRKKLWEKIINPDGSIGFWDDLISFYEELSFNFEIGRLGYYCFQMSTPILEHWGSRTFSENQNLSTRIISSYITKDEYLNHLRENNNLWIPIEQHEQLIEQYNLVSRMDYARMMFAKHWECNDYISNPQVEVHRRYVDILPSTEIKWLDKNGNEQKQII